MDTMDTLKAVEIIIETKIKVVEGDQEKFDEAIYSLALNAHRHTDITAKWTYLYDTPFFDSVYECSNCGRKQNSRNITAYCGDCGRKMMVQK